MEKYVQYQILLTIIIFNFVLAQKKSESVVAEFGKQKITLEEFKIAYLDIIKNPKVFDSPKTREDFLNEMVAERILAREAQRQGFANSKLLQNKIKAYKGKVLREQHFANIIKPKVHVEEKDVEEAYQFSQEQRKVSHLFYKEQRDADEAYDQLLHGASFDSLAKMIFKDSSLAFSGGDLGWVEWDQMDYDLATNAFRMVPDVFSKPIHSQYGYHIIKVTDFKKHPLITRQQYAEHRRKTKYVLENKLGDKYAFDYVGMMLKNASVQLRPKVLQFIDEKLSHQFKRKPKPADQMSDIQLQDAEIQFVESTLWDAQNEVVAVINGNNLTVVDFIGFLKYVPYAVVYSNFRKTFDYVVRDFLITQEAITLGLVNNKNVLLKTSLYKEFLLQEAFRNLMIQKVGIDEKEIRSYYEKNKDSYKNSTYEQLHEFLKGIVLNQKKQNCVPKFVDETLKEAPIKKYMNVINSYYDSVYSRSNE